MKKLSRITALMLAGLLLISIAACGKNDEPPAAEEDETPTVQQETTADDEDDLSDMPVPSAIVLNYRDMEITDEQLISIVEVVQEIEKTRTIPDDLEFTVQWPNWWEDIDEGVGTIDRYAPGVMDALSELDPNDIDAVAEFYGFSDDYIRISEYIRQYEEELRNTRILPDDVSIGLDLSNNQISDISAVSGLTNLTTLSIGSNQISDISAVSGLTNLTYLWISGNQISDISALAGLTNLTYLHIGNNQISDISALAGLTNLTYLHIGRNQISDISAVSGLTNLTYLWIWDNQISDAQINELQAALPECEIVS